eukprot:1342747-Amphidinium_carterae.2
MEVDAEGGEESDLPEEQVQEFNDTVVSGPPPSPSHPPTIVPDDKDDRDEADFSAKELNLKERQ